MAGNKKFNTDLDITGKIKVTNVPNRAGTVMTYDTTSKEISTRTHSEIISDLGLITATNIAAAYYTKIQLQTSGQAQVNWGNLTNIPTTFTPANHSHSEYVTLSTEQNITGVKNFQNGFDINAHKFVSIDATNVIVAGGKSAFNNSLTSISDSAIGIGNDIFPVMNLQPYDPVTEPWNNKGYIGIGSAIYSNYTGDTNYRPNHNAHDSWIGIGRGLGAGFLDGTNVTMLGTHNMHRNDVKYADCVSIIGKGFTTGIRTRANKTLDPNRVVLSKNGYNVHGMMSNIIGIGHENWIEDINQSVVVGDNLRPYTYVFNSLVLGHHHMNMNFEGTTAQADMYLDSDVIIGMGVGKRSSRHAPSHNLLVGMDYSYSTGRVPTANYRPLIEGRFKDGAQLQVNGTIIGGFEKIDDDLPYLERVTFASASLPSGVVYNASENSFTFDGTQASTSITLHNIPANQNRYIYIEISSSNHTAGSWGYKVYNTIDSGNGPTDNFVGRQTYKTTSPTTFILTTEGNFKGTIHIICDYTDVTLRSIAPNILLKDSKERKTFEVRTTQDSSILSMGLNSGKFLTHGGKTLILGNDILSETPSATNNVLVGNDILKFGSQVINNIFVGNTIGGNNTKLTHSVIIGNDTLQSNFTNTIGRLTSVGHGAGKALTAGIYNNLFGEQAGLSLITGSNNAFFGALSGSIKEGSNNTFIGHVAGGYGLTQSTVNNTIVIGANAAPEVPNNTTTIANASNTDNFLYGTTHSNAFKVRGGLATQVMMADGSLKDQSTFGISSVPLATSTVVGGRKLFSDTVQNVAATAVSATAARTYGLQVNAAGQLVVNVPWTDNNTVYSHPNSGVAAGTYRSVTVNAQGHVTAGTNPTTLSGYGITDAYVKTEVDTNFINKANTNLVNPDNWEIKASFNGGTLPGMGYFKFDSEYPSMGYDNASLLITDEFVAEFDNLSIRQNGSASVNNFDGHIWALGGITSMAGFVKFGGTSTQVLMADGSVKEQSTFGSSNMTLATSTVVGGRKLFSDTVQNVAATGVSATASRTYGIQVNAAGQMVVNVPWTNTVYSHPNSGVAAGTYKSVTVNAQGHVTAGTNPTTLSGYGITDAMSTSHAANAITSTNINNWNTAYANNHTHANKSFLDGIVDSANVNINASRLTLNPSALATDTYGSNGGFVQTAVAGSTNETPIDGMWINKIKILHSNSGGYFTELAQSFTGTEGLWHRRLVNGALSSWKQILDDNNGVTLDTAQTITGVKTFNNEVLLNGGAIFNGNTGVQIGFDYYGGEIGMTDRSNDYALVVRAGDYYNLFGRDAGTTVNDGLLRNISNGNYGLDISPSASYKLSVGGNVMASAFIKNGGTASQVLMADGSVKEQSILTQETDPTVPAHVKSISSDNISNWNNKFKNLRGTTNLDTVIESGIYRQEFPSSGYNYTTTLNLNSGDGRQQLSIARDGADMSFRGINSGSASTDWTSWKKVWHSGNFNPSTYFKKDTESSGKLMFSNDEGGIYGTMGGDDAYRIWGRSNGNDQGYLEISTADGGTEPIIVSQYTGAFINKVREAKLLDENGNTSFPGRVSAPELYTSAIFGTGSLNVLTPDGNARAVKSGGLLASGSYTDEPPSLGIMSRGRNYFHNQLGGQPSISVAIGDTDTGFNWESDGVISYYANAVKLFNLNNVWHSGNFNPDGKANAHENATGIGLASGQNPNADNTYYPYFRSTYGYIPLATRKWVEESMVTLSTNQSISGTKTFTGQVIFQGNESNNVEIFKTVTGVDQVASGLVTRWYTNAWKVGMKRGGATNSLGYAFWFSSDSGSTYSEKALIKPDGYFVGAGFIKNGGTSTQVLMANGTVKELSTIGGSNYTAGSNISIAGNAISVVSSPTFSGEVRASAFYEGSLKALKKNIKTFDQSGLDLISKLDIVTFDRLDETAKNKIGIIADDSPKEFLSEELDAVDLYKTVFIQAKAIQELKSEVDELKELVKQLLNNK